MCHLWVNEIKCWDFDPAFAAEGSGSEEPRQARFVLSVSFESLSHYIVPVCINVGMYMYVYVCVSMNSNIPQEQHPELYCSHRPVDNDGNGV